MTLPANPAIKKKKGLDPFNESNRKTQAFYVTLGVIVGLFIISNWLSSTTEVIKVIDGVVQLATVFIAGLTACDTVRYHKFGSNTLGNPEKAAKEKELKERYENR